jgi:hypothetical protein
MGGLIIGLDTGPRTKSILEFERTPKIFIFAEDGEVWDDKDAQSGDEVKSNAGSGI